MQEKTNHHFTSLGPSRPLHLLIDGRKHSSQPACQGRAGAYNTCRGRNSRPMKRVSYSRMFEPASNRHLIPVALAPKQSRFRAFNRGPPFAKLTRDTRVRQTTMLPCFPPSLHASIHPRFRLQAFSNERASEPPLTTQPWPPYPCPCVPPSQPPSSPCPRDPSACV